MLSNQTNLSHSTFTAKWVQVSETTAIWVLSGRKKQKSKGYQVRWPQEQVIQKDRQWGGYPLHIIYDKEASWSLCKFLCGLYNSNLTWSIFLIHSIDGGSTVIQRRVDGSVDFDQTWDKYEKGFGDLESEYFFFLCVKFKICHFYHLPKPYTIWICSFFPYFNKLLNNP